MTRNADGVVHANIVPVFGTYALIETGVSLICKQYVAGISLAHLLAVLKDRPRANLTGTDLLEIANAADPAEAVFRHDLLAQRLRFAERGFAAAVAAIGADVAEALAFAHAQGVVHGAVSASNVLLDSYGRILPDGLPTRDFLREPTPRRSTRRRPAGTSRISAPCSSSFSATRDAAGDVAGQRRFPHDLDGTLAELVGMARPGTAAGAGDDARRVTRERCQLLQKVPPLGPLLHFTARLPLLAMLLVPMVPQWVATAAATSYSLLRQGLPLTPAQRLEMVGVLKIYNLISYPVGLGLATLVIWPLARNCRRRQLHVADHHGDGAPRRRAVTLPFFRAAINSVCWLPALAVFIVASHRLTGRFHPSGIAHFAISLVVSWLIGTTYSALFNTVVAVRVFFTGFLEGGRKQRRCRPGSWRLSARGSSAADRRRPHSADRRHPAHHHRPRQPDA